jgi:hypothetical protein
MSNNQARLKKKILEQLAKAPIVELACRKAGVPRSTYYRWLKDDNEFREFSEQAIDHGRDSMNDMAESKLIQKVQDGEMRALIYWLENNNSRYVKPRRPVIYSHFSEQPAPLEIRFIDTDGTSYGSYEDMPKRPDDSDLNA